ncbi:calcineurin-like phosphoesterase family protein [Bacteriovorax stolpii]|nr:metallophosphoesterase [Bacteriovorax stolpii]TDP53276.1 calcineurin-like phosphoesterase family protein [Bacteriovorax stolpii]
MMNLRLGLLAFCIVGSAQAFSADLFKVAPYTLKHTNGQLLLNFQLNEDKKLVIEDGQKIKRSFEYKKGIHYQTELGKEECGVSKDLRIRDTGTNEVVFTKNYEGLSCTEGSRAPDYTFGFISDTQQYKDRHEAIAQVIAYHHSMDPLQFLINGGDVVQNGQKDEQEWIEYFLGGKAYLMDVPQIAAIGNHDYRGHKIDYALPKFFQKYMRWEGSPANGNLFFEMPGFQLVIWNSNVGDLKSDEEDQMWTWLEQKMQAAQKSNTPLIFVTHFPVYSSSLNKFTSFAVMKLRRKLVPMVEKYGVKLVLSGHTHMYERSFKDGVHYLVAGPAGGRVNKPTFKNPYVQKFDSNALTFTKVKYSNRTLKIETFNQDNTLIDQLFLNL